MWSWVDFCAGALCGYWLMPPVVRWLIKPKGEPSRLVSEAHAAHLAAHDAGLRDAREELADLRKRVAQLEANLAFKGPLG